MISEKKIRTVPDGRKEKGEEKGLRFITQSIW